MAAIVPPFLFKFFIDVIMPLIFSTFKLKLGGIVPTSNVFSKFLERTLENSSTSFSAFLQPLAFWKFVGLNLDFKHYVESAQSYTLNSAQPFFLYTQIAQNQNQNAIEDATGVKFSGEHPYYLSSADAKNLALAFQDLNSLAGTILPQQVLQFYYYKFNVTGNNDDSSGLGSFKSQALFEELQFYTNFSNVPYEILQKLQTSAFISFGQTPTFYWHENFGLCPNFKSSVEDQTDRIFDATLEPFASNLNDSGGIEILKNSLIPSVYGYRQTLQPSFYAHEIYVPYELKSFGNEVGQFSTHSQQSSFYYFKNEADYELVFANENEESEFAANGLQPSYHFYQNYADVTLAFRFLETGTFSTYHPAVSFYLYKSFADVEHKMLANRGGWQESNRESLESVVDPVSPNLYPSYSVSIETVETSNSFIFGQATFFYYYKNSSVCTNPNLRVAIEHGTFSGHSYATTFYINNFYGNDYPTAATGVTEKFSAFRKAEPIYIARYLGSLLTFKDSNEECSYGISATYSPNLANSATAAKDYLFNFTSLATFSLDSEVNALWFLYKNFATGYKKSQEFGVVSTSIPSVFDVANLKNKTQNVSILQRQFTTEQKLGSIFTPVAEKSLMSVAINELLKDGIVGEAYFVEYGQAHPFFILEAFGNVDFNQGTGVVSNRVPFVLVQSPKEYINDGFQYTTAFETNSLKSEQLGSIHGQFIANSFYERGISQNVFIKNSVELSGDVTFAQTLIDLAKNTSTAGNDWKYTGTRGIIPGSIELYPLIYLPEKLYAKNLDFAKADGTAENFTIRRADSFMHLKNSAANTSFKQYSETCRLVKAYISLKWETFSFPSQSWEFDKIGQGRATKPQIFRSPFKYNLRLAKNLTYRKPTPTSIEVGDATPPLGLINPKVYKAATFEGLGVKVEKLHYM